MCSSTTATPSSISCPRSKAQRCVGHLDALEVIRDQDELITVIEGRVRIRVELESTVGSCDAQRSSVGEPARDLLEPDAEQFGPPGHVEVAAAEVGELGDHLAQPSLAKRERPRPRNGLSGHDRVHHGSAGVDQSLGGDRFGHLDDHGNLRRAAEFAGDRKDGLDDRDVVSLALGQHDDAASVADAGEREVRSDARVTESVDNTGAPMVGSSVEHRTSQFGGIVQREHDDRVRAPLGIRQDQLLDDDRDAGRAAQDDHVPRLDHGAATATHTGDAVLDAGRDDADQRAGDQQAEERDHQCENAPSPADVAGHGAGVEDPEQALPEVLDQSAVLAAGERDAEQRQQQCAEQHRTERHDAEPGERRRRATSEDVVESIAESFAEGHVDRVAAPIGGAGHSAAGLR